MHLTRHADVRRAAKEWQTYSSDLQGDPDVRDYRQLPLEADPPAHRRYRNLLEPFFGRRAVGAMTPAIHAVCEQEVRRFVSAGGGDAIHDLAFPVVLHSLAVAFQRPADLDEWTRWGIETWITRPDGTRDGAHLDRYLTRVMTEARTRPDAVGDIFQQLAAARIDGRPLDDAEFRGIAGLVLAGGRDTVIKLVAGAIWHLARTPADLAWLQADLTRLDAAIEEWLRWLSPLPRMVRDVRQADPCSSVRIGDRVHLDFLAANHDDAVFPDAACLRLDRHPSGHLAFGSGPHTCIGAHLARVQAQGVLAHLIRSVSTLTIDGPCDIVFETVGATAVPIVMRRIPVSLILHDAPIPRPGRPPRPGV